MTSLYPGMLFYSTGLNRKSTPCRPETTPSEIDRKLGRAPFNGRPWPKNSPVSAVYDVRNSSTRMIILNNKLSKKPKGSRLRGQSDYEGDIVQPEPDRHLTDSPHTNWTHHKQCSVSVSEKFVPIYPPGVSPMPEWVNKTQRPPMKFDNGSGVNPNHHIQCQGHADYDIIRWYNAHRRPRSRTSTRDSRALSPILNDKRMTNGERRYLSGIAKIYSVEDMRQQKQLQYNQLMWKEISKGGYKPKDWERYNRYLNTPRKTQFGPCDQFRHKRSISAPGKRQDSGDEGEDSRPNTTRTDARSSKGSRGSVGPGYRPSDRRASNKSGSQQSSKQIRGRQPRGSRQKQQDLTGKPARKESPLPLKPKMSPTSSMSSLREEPEDEKRSKDEEKVKETEEKKGKELSPKEKEKSAQESEPLSQKEKEEVDESKERASDVKITVDEVEDKRMSDEDDERSKISARDERSEEPRGESVEYHPTYGDRSGEEERSQDEGNRVSSRETYQYTDQTRSQQESEVKEEPKQEPKETEKEKDSTETPQETKQDVSSKKEEEEVVRLEKVPESPYPSSKSQEEQKSQPDTFTEDGPELVHHVHKEGKDRPLSRLGGREQFMVIKKEPERENSDDDYSDDEEESERSKQRAEDATDQVRGDHSDRTQANSVDGRAGEQEKAVAGKTNFAVSDGRAADEDDKESELRLGIQKEDGTSVVSSRTVEGSTDQSKGSVLEPATPTEASTQEKPSEISTIEY